MSFVQSRKANFSLRITTRQRDACSAKFGTGAEPWPRSLAAARQPSAIAIDDRREVSFGLINFFFLFHMRIHDAQDMTLVVVMRAWRDAPDLDNCSRNRRAALATAHFALGDQRPGPSRKGRLPVGPSS